MKVQEVKITIKDLVEGYVDNQEEGVRGYGGKLDIRPPYQREFIYKDAQRNAVIETVKKGFPLNLMYWAVNDDGTFEIIDGQQRTISICEYVIGNFSLNDFNFHNLYKEEQAKILDYELSIYQCKGTDREKLEWFQVINIAGEELTKQELRNAVYKGSFVSDAKRYFSKTGCPAYKIASKYINGAVNRQAYLETAIKWISDNKIEDYMAQNQHKEDAKELWNYFQSVIAWVQRGFKKYRKEMKGVDWGKLYKDHKNEPFKPEEIEEETRKLMEDYDVTSKKGIYTYILERELKFLSIRAFDDRQKRQVYEKQDGKCKDCKKEFPIEEMDADHITPWIEGGHTVIENCQMLCKKDNRKKGAR
ncbi:HNH endonuclease [Elysia marginata]|uniref:HNH endonuclease n=1 Tax=Elysia marginata TaxID=1093978 RepID=A0AAV4G7V1_9GAST|nr:HNH endonuclease [Elysia marginata]